MLEFFLVLNKDEISNSLLYKKNCISNDSLENNF